MGTTTLEISLESHVVYRSWCKRMKLTSVEFMDKFVDTVKCRKQQIFYDSLPDPRKIKSTKLLSGIRIRKNYRKKSY